jgi:hypothetical protein
MVEQGTHKPLDVSSNLTLATRKASKRKNLPMAGFYVSI